MFRLSMSHLQALKIQIHKKDVHCIVGYTTLTYTESIKESMFIRGSYHTQQRIRG
jgi:hypothetical protein